MKTKYLFSILLAAIFVSTQAHAQPKKKKKLLYGGIYEHRACIKKNPGRMVYCNLKTGRLFSKNSWAGSALSAEIKSFVRANSKAGFLKKKTGLISEQLEQRELVFRRTRSRLSDFNGSAPGGGYNIFRSLVYAEFESRRDKSIHVLAFLISNEFIEGCDDEPSYHQYKVLAILELSRADIEVLNRTIRLEQ